MEDLKRYFVEGLAVQIDALEQAERSLRTAPAESMDTIVRVAHDLRDSGRRHGLPEIAEAASLVANATKDRVADHLPHLLHVLREASAAGAKRSTGILVVEDGPTEAEILESVLTDNGYRVFVASTAEDARRVLERKNVGVVLLDLFLPDGDGRNLLVHLRKSPATAGVPVFVIAGKVGDEVEAECLALGADRFIRKPFNAEMLSLAVGAAIQRSARAVQDSRQDPLTGLPNRAAFHEAFAEASSVLTWSSHRLSAAIIDLDHFRRVNDTHGHAMGDEVLRRIATLLKDNLRKSDFVARRSGDEFVVLFPETTPKGAAVAMGNALAAVRGERFRTADGAEVGLTFSAGVSEAEPEATVEEVLAEADHYLYLAKASGRNRILWPGAGVTVPHKTIVLAEDDPSTARAVISILRGEGFEVLHCSDAREALDSAQDSDVVLGILDVDLPGMDGFEVLERFREQPEHADTPFVLLSGGGGEEDVVRGFELGADDYVIKPFSPTELQARVHRLLRRG